MPKKIVFDKIGNKYHFEQKINLFETRRNAMLTVPIQIVRENETKWYKVTLEPID